MRTVRFILLAALCFAAVHAEGDEKAAATETSGFTEASSGGGGFRSEPTNIWITHTTYDMTSRMTIYHDFIFYRHLLEGQFTLPSM